MASTDRIVPAVPSATGSPTYSPSRSPARFRPSADFGENIKGVKFADVRDGSPAAKASIIAGDVMVESMKPITNLYDFTYALQSKKQGDEVNVKVLRDGQPVVARVLLTKRP